MPGPRWVITPSWLSGSWRSFLYISPVYCWLLFLISSASVSFLEFLSFFCVHLYMKYSLDVSNFLEEISSLSHSIVFCYFFALIAEEGFLISHCYSLEPCIQMGISFLFSFTFQFSGSVISDSLWPLASLLFLAIFKASSDNHFAFFLFFFLGLVLITASCTVLWTSVHSSSGTLSHLVPWI